MPSRKRPPLASGKLGRLAQASRQPSGIACALWPHCDRMAPHTVARAHAAEELLYNRAMPRIFVSQRRVHQWTEEGRVSVDGNTMNLPELGRTFKLTEAFFVERVVSEGGDAFKLTGRVKTRAQIAALGGEVFLNSLIIGDAAYEGDPGFVGEPTGAATTASAPAPAAAAAPAASGKPSTPPPAPVPAAARARRDGPSQAGVIQSGTINTSNTGNTGNTANTATSSRDKGSLLGVGPSAPPPGTGRPSRS